jgi:hypothetical protein
MKTFESLNLTILVKIYEFFNSFYLKKNETFLSFNNLTINEKELLEFYKKSSK